jgi:pimeloyl-ACP methyl ester carboxylesterase
MSEFTAGPGRIDCPTAVVWGDRDRYSGQAPISLVPYPVQALALWPRNREALWRLAASALKPRDLD